MFTLLARLALVHGGLAQEVHVVPDVKLVARTSNAQALSPDEKELAFNAEFHGMHRYRDDVSVRFVSLTTGKVRLSVPGFDPWIDDIAWSPDGSVVAVVGHNGAVRIIRSSDGSLASETPPPPEIVRPSSMDRTVHFVDGGTKLLLAGGASPVQLREREGGKVLADFLLVPNMATSAVCVSRDGVHFAVGDSGGVCAVYSAKTGTREAGPFTGFKTVNALALDPNAAQLAIGATGCEVLVCPLRPDAIAFKLSHCDQDFVDNLEIGSVDFSSDGKTLLATSFPFYEVRLWNLEGRTETWRCNAGGGNPVAMSARFTADPSIVVVSRGGDVLDAATGKARLELQNPCGTCSFRSDGHFAWTTTASGLRVHDLRDGKVVAEVDLREPIPR